MLGNDQKAYRCGWIGPFEPIAITCLPNYNRWARHTPVVQGTTLVRVANMIFALGNPYYGTFGSPVLETVYEQSPDSREGRRKPPLCVGEPAADWTKPFLNAELRCRACVRLTDAVREGRPQSFASDREFAWRVGMSDLEDSGFGQTRD